MILTMETAVGIAYVMHPVEYERLKAKNRVEYVGYPGFSEQTFLLGSPIYINTFLPHPDSFEAFAMELRSIWASARSEVRAIWKQFREDSPGFPLSRE